MGADELQHRACKFLQTDRLASSGPFSSHEPASTLLENAPSSPPPVAPALAAPRSQPYCSIFPPRKRKSYNEQEFGPRFESCG